MPENPQKGKGYRNLNCSHYEKCLDHAAKKDWKSFDCEKCALRGQPVKNTHSAGQTEKKKKICAKCSEKPTLHPNSPYCSSCLQGMKRAKKKGPGTEKSAKCKGPEESKNKNQSNDKAETKKPSFGQVDNLVDEFEEYATLISEIQALAIKETRPFEWQVIHMLKCQLNNSKQA